MTRSRINYVIIDQVGNRFNYNNQEAAMNKLIAFRRLKQVAFFEKNGERLFFENDPLALRNAGYSNKEILEQFSK